MVGLAQLKDSIPSQVRSDNFGRGGHAIRAEIIPLVYQLPEGDLSVDVLRGLCETEDLTLRDPVYTGWYGFVREVNVGISLYYLVEGGRLQKLSQKYQRRQAADRKVTGWLESRIISRLSPKRVVRENLSGRSQKPSPTDTFIYEVSIAPLDERSAFVRYLGRVMSAWLDCGDQSATFPSLASAKQIERLRAPAARVARGIGAAADIVVPYTQIVSAWSMGSTADIQKTR